MVPAAETATKVLLNPTGGPQVLPAKPQLKRTTVAAGVFVIFLGALLLWLLPSGPQPPQAKLLNVQDKMFQYKFSLITHGTNHVVFRGNSAVAKLKWKVFHSPFRPLYGWFPRRIHADWYATTTGTSASVLWIGWTQRRYMTSLQCSLTDSSGHIEVLATLSGPIVSAHGDSLFVQPFELPTNLTSHKGCTVQILCFKSGSEKDVASLQLQ